MKRILGFTAAAALAIGMIPFAASAGAGHTYEPIGDTGFAVGLETPGSQARTCAFVETPTGWHAVGVGAGVYYQSSEGPGAYDAHNTSEADSDGSICSADKADEDAAEE